MKLALSLALAAVLVTGCAPKTTVTRRPEPTAGIPSAAIGLNLAEITDVPDPLLFQVEDAEPGELPLPERAYYISPPSIPHTLADTVPITLSANECIECHGVAEKEPGEPTPIPASHYVDQRRAPGEQGDTVAGARYNCMSCHVAQSDAQPLVENQF